MFGKNFIIITFTLFLSIFSFTNTASAWELAGSNEIDGLQGSAIAIDDVSITGTGDEPIPVKLLVSNGSLAMTTTTGLTFDGPQTGNTLYFEGSLVNVNAALATLTYTRAGTGTDTLEISLVEPGEVFFEGTGHLYEYIADPNSFWADSQTDASLLTRYGATGYLVTITSPEENDFVAERLANAGWMGASDAGPNEGNWQWVTGPIAEQVQFWSGDENGSEVPGGYANWAEGEPNDDSDEDCAQFLAGGSGEWNDLQCDTATLPGFVVEFGADGDTPQVAAKSITINTFTAAQIALEKISSYAADGTNPTPTVQNYLDLGITGVDADTLAIANEVINNVEEADADTQSEVQALVDQGISHAKIRAYAADETNPTPTVDDYTNIGVNEVNADNLAEMNAYIAGQEESDVEEISDIQSMADTVVAIIKIQEYADTDGASTAPTVSDYTDAGITGIDGTNLAEMNETIANSEADDIQSANDIQSISNTVVAIIKIQEYANTDGASTAPTVSDYTDAGISGVTSNNIAEINELIAGSDPADLESIEDLSLVVDQRLDELSAASNSTQSSSRRRMVSFKPTTQTTTTPTASTTPASLTEFVNQYRSVFLAAHAAGIVLPESLLSLLGVTGAETPMVRDLSLNMTGEDVRSLQKFLNQNGFILATSGAGSTGNETNFFGSLTQKALVRYQQAHNITPASGGWDQATRETMKSTNPTGLWW